MTAELEILADEDLLEDMPTFEHGIICTNLSSEIRSFIKGKNLGRVVDSTPEYRFLEKTDKKKKSGKQPDVSFVREEKLPARFRSYPDVAPDLAVEVVSPTDRPYEIEATIKQYQEAGVSLIWIVHPYSRSIDVYTIENGFKAQTFTEDEEINGASVIPGFKLKLSEIFDYPSDPDPEPQRI
jgi:Uma2 family endonuclease